MGEDAAVIEFIPVKIGVPEGGEKGLEVGRFQGGDLMAPSATPRSRYRVQPESLKAEYTRWGTASDKVSANSWRSNRLDLSEFCVDGTTGRQRAAHNT